MPSGSTIWKPSVGQGWIDRLNRRGANNRVQSLRKSRVAGVPVHRRSRRLGLQIARNSRTHQREVRSSLALATPYRGSGASIVVSAGDGPPSFDRRHYFGDYGRSRQRRGSLTRLAAPSAAARPRRRLGDLRHFARSNCLTPPLGAVGGHPPAHRFGEPRHQQAFDGESKPDRDHEVAKLSPPWPTGPDRPPFPAEASASRNSGRNPTWD